MMMMPLLLLELLLLLRQLLQLSDLWPGSCVRLCVELVLVTCVCLHRFQH